MNNMNTLSLHITDLQIHNYKRFDNGGNRLDNCINVIRDVYEFCNKNKINLITFAGDLFDSQKGLPTPVINATIRAFHELIPKNPQIIWLAIDGNHDQCEKNLLNNEAESSLEFLTILYPDNFYLINNRQISLQSAGINTVIHGIPYYEYAEHYHQRLQERSKVAAEFKAKGFKNLLMIHQTPNGSTNPNIKIDTDVHDPLYEPFDFIWCGHIHTKQEITPKFYLGGSPIHRDFGDEGVDKGWWLQDLETLLDPAFYSLRGRYPEFKRVKADAVPSSMANDYVMLEPPKEIEVPIEVAEQVANFDSKLAAAPLVENFWKQADGKDKELLAVGLDFIE